MRNPQSSIKDRVVKRLRRAPDCLDMGEFSRIEAGCGTTFCLAGIILDESGVRMEYGRHGVALTLGKGVALPSEEWIGYEVSISARKVDRSRVLIAAKARETWAADHGKAAAEMLPFYAADWGVDVDELGAVTAVQVIELLQVINEVASRAPVDQAA